MSNVQFYILLLTTFGGVLWTRTELHQLGTQLNGRIDQLSGRIDRLEGRIDRLADELEHLFREIGRHEKAIEILERHS